MCHTRHKCHFLRLNAFKAYLFSDTSKLNNTTYGVQYVYFTILQYHDKTLIKK